jgi:hypothetical protein
MSRFERAGFFGFRDSNDVSVVGETYRTMMTTGVPTAGLTAPPTRNDALVDGVFTSRDEASGRA